MSVERVTENEGELRRNVFLFLEMLQNINNNVWREDGRSTKIDGIPVTWIRNGELWKD